MATFGKRKATGLDTKYARVRSPSDKRGSDRVRVFKDGKVTLSDRSEIDCIVRDVSEGGCLVSAIGAESFPEKLIIRLGASGRPRKARVAWRDQGLCGLQFLD